MHVTIQAVTQPISLVQAAFLTVLTEALLKKLLMGINQLLIHSKQYSKIQGNLSWCIDIKTT